jgi:hypothetical protein
VEAEAEQLATSLVGTVLIYCADYRCSHSVAVMADQWADDVRLSDIEDRFTRTACGKRGADVRPDFNWDKQPIKALGYRWRCYNLRAAGARFASLFRRMIDAATSAENVHEPLATVYILDESRAALRLLRQGNEAL